MRRMRALALSVLLAAGCAQTPPEMALVEDAAAALGGRDKIQAIQALSLEGEGTNGNLGQNRTPDSELDQFKVTGFKRSLDLANGRARQEQLRTPTFPWPIPPATQNFGVDGNLAFNIGANGMATGQSERVAKDRRAEYLFHHPVAVVRAALNPAAKVSNRRTAGASEVVDITTAGGEMLTLAVDATTKLPTSVTSMVYNANLGDVALETTFGGYQDVDGVKAPTRLTTKLDKWPTVDITIARTTVNAAVDNLKAPEGVQAAGAPMPNVTAEQMAPGIWFLAGQSHNSVLVEFADHGELIETPQNDTRALAVIAKARELLKDKPLT